MVGGPGANPFEKIRFSTVTCLTFWPPLGDVWSMYMCNSCVTFHITRMAAGVIESCSSPSQRKTITTKVFAKLPPNGVRNYIHYVMSLLSLSITQKTTRFCKLKLGTIVFLLLSCCPTYIPSAPSSMIRTQLVPLSQLSASSTAPKNTAIFVILSTLSALFSQVNW